MLSKRNLLAASAMGAAMTLSAARPAPLAIRMNPRKARSMPRLPGAVLIQAPKTRRSGIS